MNMIEKIDITDFRGVKSCESPLKLSDLTVIVGRNNSGKSSVLEAIHCLRIGQDPLFGFSKVNLVKNLHSNKNLAHRYSGEAELKYEFEGQNGSTKVQNNISHQATVNDFNGNTILYPSGDKYVDRAYGNLKSVREGIEKDGAHIRVVDFLNQSIGDHYTEIYLETLEARKKPENTNPYWVDIKDLGSGLINTIPVFLTIEYHKPEIFLWDDFGTSLHPGLLLRVLEWLSESGSQIVLSTHSIDVLSSLLEVSPQNASVIQLSKSEDDILRHTTLDLEDLELTMENAGHDPRYLAEAMEI